MKCFARYSVCITLLTIWSGTLLTYVSPKIAIVLVIDQVPYLALQQLKPHLCGGIKYLMNYGIHFTNAYYPHALPATATGHAALNTGAFAKDHGIIGNNWFDKTGKKIHADDDFSGTADVFGANEKESPGKSACNLMVDGVSDTMMLHQGLSCSHKVFSLSLKSRAAIMCAGHLGKALWFDSVQGKMTSSKAYFDALPSWLTAFNSCHPIAQHVTWNLRHCATSDYYGCAKNFKAPNYTLERLAGKTVSSYTTHDHKKSYQNFLKTPHATQLLFDAAKKCIQEELTCSKDQQLLIWISLSSTDFIGHEFGTQSIEYIDMLYHIDYQLKHFMNDIHHLVRSSDVFWLLTSDHGASPVPELSQAQGYNPAMRTPISAIEHELNKAIQEQFGISPIVRAFDSPNIYLNTTNMAGTRQQQKKIIDTSVALVTATPGIKRAWSYEQLQQSCVIPYSAEFYYKQQLYPGRSGDIIFQVEPYVLVSRYPGGTTHETPYNYDTHVPLMIYQKGCFEQKIINDTVLMLQVAPTLAHILRVPKPSACTFSFLPGTITHEILK